jgi:hypothetical protein
MLKPASKDDLAKAYREAIYEMQNGDTTNVDPHLAEKLLLNDHIVGWDNTLLDSKDEPIPYSAGIVSKQVNIMDQASRDLIYGVIVSPARNRSKLVEQEKNG